MENSPRKVTHVIFDLDGTLLDTESLHEQVNEFIANKFSKSFSSIKSQVLDVTGKHLYERIVQLLDLPISPDEYYDMSREKTLQVMKNVQIKKGAADIVKHLHNHQIPIAIATSCKQASYENKITNHKEVFDLFDHVVCGGSDEEVKNIKPAPDVFLVCASRFKEPPKPENCLVFEDAITGVEAALKAGMQVVFIPNQNIPKEYNCNATLTASSFNVVNLEHFGLPPIK